MELYYTQKVHFDNLIRTLSMHKLACDASSTGAGKTIVCIKLAKHFQLPLMVIGPPILRANWEKICQLEKVELTFVSAYVLDKTQVKKDMFVAIDECHLFKNHCQRGSHLKALLRTPCVKYALFISATFFDHQRQEASVTSLLRGLSVYDITHAMTFQYPTESNFVVYHVLTTEEEAKKYSKGERQIASSVRPDGEIRFAPGIFQNGLRNMHTSLMSGLMRTVSLILKRPRSKLIVALKYKAHFTQFLNKFPEALALNGETSAQDRNTIVNNFQQHDLKYRLLCLTDAVGGVGIDLDDTHGSFPRVIICLPMFASDFLQLVGRVRRRSSKSNSTVLVVQPRRTKTYFTRQLETKMPIVGKLNTSCAVTLDVFKRAYEHLTTCCVTSLKRIVLIDQHLDRHIHSFACECSLN